MGFLNSGDDGRVGVVTGGAQGMGLAVAERMAMRGMNVVVADFAAQATLDAAVSRISKSAKPGRRVIAVPTNVTKPEDNEALCSKVYAEFNDCAILHLNAGVSVSSPTENRPKPMKAAETSPTLIPIADWEKTFSVNMYGTLNGIRAFVPKMVASGKECVVAATSSYAGLINTSMAGSAGTTLPYTGSKHVVTLIMEALQHELRSTPDCRVRACCLHPAVTATNFGATIAAASGVEAPKASLTAQQPGARNTAPGSFQPLQPEGIADLLEAAISENRFYCLAHDSETKDYYKEIVRTRFEDIVEERPPLSHLLRDDAGIGKASRARIVGKSQRALNSKM